MNTNLTVCIGYDSKEPVTWMVLAHSILTRASKPVTIIPINLKTLQGVYTRTDPAGTTEFSLSRFLTPWLCHYQGYGLFMDSDMLCLTDIYDVFADASGRWDAEVYACQHDYTPKADTLKATGMQTAYPRKNWSSFMLFHNPQLERVLTPEYVNGATPADLHRFRWAQRPIGDIPLVWNWLVGEYAPNPDAKVLHYTLGAPCFPGYERCDHADLWWNELEQMMKPATYWTGSQAKSVKDVAKEMVRG